MRRFAALYRDLDACQGHGERIEALLAFFRAVEPAEAAWALQVLLGRQRRRLISGRRLREICRDALDLPAWLLEECHAQVGDSAETIALLWPGRTAAAGPHGGGGGPDPAERGGVARTVGTTWPDLPLQQWMQELLPQAAALSGAPQAEAVLRLWRDLEPQELLVVNKLLGGALRVGVGEGLVLRALAQLSGREEALLRHRLMGGFQPGAAAYQLLLAEPEGRAEAETVPSRPYPFCLAVPLEQAMGGRQRAIPAPAPATSAIGDAAGISGCEGPVIAAPAGVPDDWLLEWKWDGIRAQLIRRVGQSYLWSRGEEMIQAAFPELIEAAALLPEGTVLDGELLVWPAERCRPAPFSLLQRRLGRLRPERGLRRQYPVVMLAYDLLERDGIDIRSQPLSQRRAALEALLHAGLPATAKSAAGVLRLSPRLTCSSWQELADLRQAATTVGAEGLMLKALDAPYRTGRRRGVWWKHKRDPWRLDAVLLYAQAGSGRRASLYTDYTFALWDQPLPVASQDGDADSDAAAGGGERQLVSFAKAYSGLDDREILQLDRWIRSHTIERYGPVRAVQPLLVFELALEGLQRSGRHKSGIAVRFPRIHRWRHDKTAAEADCLADALALLAMSEEPAES